MRLAGAFAAVRGSLRRDAAGCGSCGHYRDDPAEVEAALPGLSAFASTRSSVWAAGGLCLHQDRVINGRRRCLAFTATRVHVPTDEPQSATNGGRDVADVMARLPDILFRASPT